MFRNFSQRNVNLTFTVSGVEALQLVMDEIKNKRHLIVSFSTEIVECGEKKNLRVALVVRTRKLEDEVLLIQFIQTLPGVVIDKVE